MSDDNGMPSGGDGQNWPAYNAAQVNEKPQFIRILHELCKDVEEPVHTTGRRPYQLKDVTFCLVYSTYTLLSSRRSQYDLDEAQAKGLLAAVPSPTSIASFMRRELMTDILQHLITKSCLPLVGEEKMFAVDSTGLSLPHRRIWFNPHKKRREKKRDYVKLHVMCGTKTNIITCAEVTDGKAYDGSYLKLLLKGTARYFEVSEVLADGGYLSGENMLAVLNSGAIPYFAFRKDNTLDADYKSTFWRDMLYLFKTRHPLFTEHYFLRNNVEATFHSLKAKFGGRLRSKSPRGQINEALCKVLCHNICALIRAMYYSGIDPISWSEEKLKPRDQPGSMAEALAPRAEELLKIREAAGDRELPPEEKMDKRFHKLRRRMGTEEPSRQASLF
jgi:transposase